MSQLAVTIGGNTHRVEIDLFPPNGSEVRVKVDGYAVRVSLPDWNTTRGAMEWVLVDDRSYEIVFDPDLQWIRGRLGIHRLEIRDLDAVAPPPRSGDGRVKAPIPGQITQVMVSLGQGVEAGQPLLILEAMKLENEIRAPRSGQVSAIHVTAGQGVALNEVLIEII
jgi:acetyl/propionyl-CoA carboxylase alpha subunit